MKVAPSGLRETNYLPRCVENGITDVRLDCLHLIHARGTLPVHLAFRVGGMVGAIPTSEFRDGRPEVRALLVRPEHRRAHLPRICRPQIHDARRHATFASAETFLYAAPLVMMLCRIRCIAWFSGWTPSSFMELTPAIYSTFT